MEKRVIPKWPEGLDGPTLPLNIVILDEDHFVPLDDKKVADWKQNPDSKPSESLRRYGINE